jgi:CheY-like chemotaxis protein
MPPRSRHPVKQHHWVGLAQFSHEVRNHLNGILGLTALLKENNSPEKQREIARRIESAGEALLTIVNNLLAANRSRQSSLGSIVSFNPAELIEDIAAMLSPSAEAQGLELICTTNSFTVGNIRGDASGFRQLVTNLITNAIKFTERGHIVVSLEGKRIGSVAELRLEVTDTGIGISPAQQKQIFQPFVQLAAGKKSPVAGSGLGLAIVQKISQSMSGELTLKSRLGHGSTFCIELTLPTAPFEKTSPHFTRPCLIIGGLLPQRRWLAQILSDWGAPCSETDLSLAGGAIKKIRHQTGQRPLLFVDIASGATDIPQLTNDTILLRSLSWNLSQHTALTKPLTARNLFEAICNPNPKYRSIKNISRRILLVEDHIVNQEIIATFLRRNGHRVDVVSTARAAADRLKAQHYDVALVDLGLPDISGLTLARNLQKQKPLLPLIAISGNQSPSLKERCRRAGFAAQLTKPCHPPFLIETLERIVQETQENQADQQRACVILFKGLREECARLEMAYQTGRAEVIAPALHALRGALAMAGLRSWTQRAAKIEQLATANDTQPALKKLQKFISDLRRFAQSVSSS